MLLSGEMVTKCTRALRTAASGRKGYKSPYVHGQTSQEQRASAIPLRSRKQSEDLKSMSCWVSALCTSSSPELKGTANASIPGMQCCAHPNTHVQMWGSSDLQLRVLEGKLGIAVSNGGCEKEDAGEGGKLCARDPSGRWNRQEMARGMKEPERR